MSIIFKDSTFKIDTKNTTYSMKIIDFGYLMHGYYGGKISDLDLQYVCPKTPDRSYIAAPEADKKMLLRLNDVPQEYSGYGIGDFRTTALRLKHADGSRAADLRYFSHEITDGAVSLDGLPSARQNGEDGVSSLKITLKDTASEVFVHLYYTVFENTDVIARTTIVENKGETPVFVEKAASLQLDFLNGDMDLIQLSGAWARERQIVRTHLHDGFQGFASRRGTSSHQHNPFFVLCDKNTDEWSGSAYGVHLMYSGNHRTEIELSQYGAARVLVGINDEGFSYEVKSNEKFTAPQAFFTHSENGLSKMSENLHKFIRRHIFAPQWYGSRRPLLINNWEATYFDFDEDKLVSLAETAGKLGIELLVMDDGWFGHREGDDSSLGDWVPYKKRLAGGLEPLARRVNEKGVKFGIWVEPEMISEDSDLYLNHPDWVMCIPNRPRTVGRNQFVLDLAKEEVKQYVLDAVLNILGSADIAYMKWDMNRYLTDAYSKSLQAENQGETYHRYVLALYDILNTITEKYPHLLIEHCSGGGGRFDTGMLYYSPQIWTSDDTDAAERVNIQFGTSLGYPITSMGSHLSASPNHQTGRLTSFDTRAAVAYSGTFGYELDINRLTDDEREQIKKQCAFYKEHYDLINYGRYYRLADEHGKFAAWCFMSPDSKEILLTAVNLSSGANDADRLLRIPCADKNLRYTDTQTGENYFGDTLCRLGIALPFTMGERISFIKHFTAE